MEKENNLRPINLKEEINVVILCRALPVNEWMNAIAFKVVLICVSKNSYENFKANAQFDRSK